MERRYSINNVIGMPSDDVLSPLEVSAVNVPFSDDVFQNLTVNVNVLWYSQSRGIDIFIDVVNLT